MSIDLPLHLKQRVRAHAEQAGYETIDELVRSQLERHFDKNPLERTEIEAALAESEARSARGQTITLERLDRQMRAEYGFSR